MQDGGKIGCGAVHGARGGPGAGEGRLTALSFFLSLSLSLSVSLTPTLPSDVTKVTILQQSRIFKPSIVKHEISGFRGVENTDCRLCFYLCLLNDDVSIFGYTASNKELQRSRSWPLLTYVITYLLTESIIHLHTHSLTHSLLTDSLIHLHTYLVTHSLLTDSLIHLHIHSLTLIRNLLTHSFTYILT